MSVKLENKKLLVEIAELGAEVTKIYDKEKNTEVLWDGNPKFWKRHSPILFPNVGKTWQNKVLISGEEYPAPSHGFARDSVFACVEHTADLARFLLFSSEKTREVYPYDFKLYVTYKLQGKELNVEWTVENCSQDTMYFTIGGHPAFKYADPSEKKEDYKLKFPGKQEIISSFLDLTTGTTIPGKHYALELQDEMCVLKEELFENDTLILDDNQVDEVWLCHKDGTPYVGVKCEGFPNFGIWSVKDSGFVCLEPWMGRCDESGFTSEISEKKNVNQVKAGEEFRKNYTIIVA